MKIEVRATTYKEFVANIDDNTPENILFQVPSDTLKNKMSRLVFNAQARMLLENSILESLYFTDNCLMLIFRNDEKFFQLDMCNDFGVTLAEILPTEKIDFWHVDLKS